ncbi:hypothetical protein L207DRAFT_583500 [Hyaloscypha variabilis F]|uniref:Uncharacterized protein n=1 Tax=Hyaloscypha variabilis (strain UAMH 11265 / GT02V1 / F) TaxID=1149755 RepID=A0A2J6RMA3_HYAVF|nr:hypothetical protein L207DRAFT_583500 [Hyaloscypha variabilis F]
MASRHPLDSANRPLAIDRPLIQYPHPSQGTGENPVTGPSGSANIQSDQADLADDLSSLFAKTVDILRSINHKIHEVGTSHESHSASALLRHRYVERRLDMLVNYDEDKLSSLFDPLLEMRPAMVKNSEILLENIRQFHKKEMDQLATQEATMDSIYTAQIDRWDEFSMQLKTLHKAHVEAHEKMSKELKDHSKMQNEDHEFAAEKLEDMLDRQSDMHNVLTERLQEIYDRQELQEENLMEKLSAVHKDQTQLEINSMVKLNETQQQLADAVASHSKWSVLMYAAQERILDRLTAMEDRIDVFEARSASSSDQGSDTVNGAPVELRVTSCMLLSEKQASEMLSMMFELTEELNLRQVVP